jgi:hypothetical protein
MLFLLWFPPLTVPASEIEPPDLAPLGEGALEVSLLIQRDISDDGNGTTYALPQPHLILGIFENFEIQLEADGRTIENPDGQGSNSFTSDFFIAGKVGLTEENGLNPKSAVFMLVGFPTGSEKVTSGGIDPFFRWLGKWGLPNDLSLTLNVGFGFPTNGPDEENRFFQISNVLNLAFPILQRMTGFVEYFNRVQNEGESDAHAVDAGFVYEFNDVFYTEFTATKGITEPAPAYAFKFLVGANFKLSTVL